MRTVKTKVKSRTIKYLVYDKDAKQNREVEVHTFKGYKRIPARVFSDYLKERNLENIVMLDVLSDEVNIKRYEMPIDFFIEHADEIIS